MVRRTNNLNIGNLMSSRTLTLCVGLLCVVSCFITGCANPWFSRKKDISELKEAKRLELKELLESDERPQLLREVSRKVVTGARVENVALVTGLPGTGGKVEPSQQREKLLEMMRQKDVENPNQWLDDPSTAMVAVQVIVPPASRKGDRLNAILKLSSHAEGTSLDSGWLMRTELVEMSTLGGQVREGFGYAIVEGPLVTQAQISGSDKPEAAVVAMVVGGAALLKSRKLGLVVDEQYAHAITMTAILPAINQRFTFFDGQQQDGAAKPQQENYIELEVPPRYRRDVDHFANVVMHIGILDSADQKRERMEMCRRQLAEPTTARQAAWQLEAIGKEAIPILVDYVQHPDKEVRFYSAHALAYLNDPRCLRPLAELARTEPAFRAMCLNGISLVERFEARDVLEELLNAEDAETRYGAVIALRERDSGDGMVEGEKAANGAGMLFIPSTAPGLVAISLTKVPEVVVFGDNPTLRIPAFLYVNPRLMLRMKPDGRVTVSHLVAGHDDRIVDSSLDLRSMLTAIADVGGGYGDWVNFLRICGAEKYLSVQVAINPVADAGRTYHRDGDQHEPGDTLLEGNLENAPAIPPPPELVEANKEDPSWFNILSWWGRS